MIYDAMFAFLTKSLSSVKSASLSLYTQRSAVWRTVSTGN